MMDRTKTIPVIGWFVKACNVASDIQAYRFCKKIYKFVFLTQDYDRKELEKFWHEYSEVNQENVRGFVQEFERTEFQSISNEQVYSALKAHKLDIGSLEGDIYTKKCLK